MKLEEGLLFDDGCLYSLSPEEVTSSYVEGLNDPQVNNYLDLVGRSKQTTESVTTFVKNELISPNSILFGIWVGSPTRLVGTLRLHKIDQYHKNANIGVCLFETEVWGRGIGTQAIRTSTAWAQEKLGICWLEAGIHSENIASQRSFLKAGYVHQCTFTKKYRQNGTAMPVEIYAAVL